MKFVKYLLLNNVMSACKTVEDFIKRAKEVHGDRYDYSKVKYINSKTDVCIICPIHGEFWQKPYNHYKGCGCPQCGGIKKSNTIDFIEKAKQIHGDKYDYSKVNYINNHTKVCIICPKHGEFWQMPHNHLKGQDCPNCKGKKLSNEQKIEKAKIIHNDKYDYSKSNFSIVKEKTKIICPIHGVFLMDYDHHVNGKNGCPKCGGKYRYTTCEYEEKVKKIHNDFYTYHQDYSKMHDKIKITCPIHGDFYQEAQAHLCGQGCPKCIKQPILEKEIENLLKENNIKYLTQVGYSKFNWLGLQSLDFYLPDYNVAIECQGKQHFEPRDFSGHNPQQAKDNFEIQKNRDIQKYKKCKEHSLEILYYAKKKPKEKYFSKVYDDKNKLINKLKNIK